MIKLNVWQTEDPWWGQKPEKRIRRGSYPPNNTVYYFAHLNIYLSVSNLIRSTDKIH